ncbi:MAG: hypothetical protein HKN46_07855, partial [Acidimicrobiia bacterium]|nr:hypothetical protein [Acidimicrobiia bacterium]
MRSREQSVLSEVLPADERVIEAVVARYQRVAPAVTRFARKLADNEELQVRLGSHASSSANDVVIDPGVFQAAYARRAPVTPTEVALASALHEVFHLVATDFDDRRPIPPEWQPQAHQEVLQEEEPEHPTADLLVFDDDEDDEPDVIDQLFAGELDDTPAEPEKLVTVLDALNAVAGPAAEAMFLALEDARQEATFFGEYHGAWSVLRDLYLASVPEAMAQSRPLGQFALSCFLMAAGYLDRDTLQRRVEPHVAMALDDAVGFIDQLADTDDPWDVGSLALQLLQVAKLHHVVEEAGVAETKTQSKARMDDERNQIAETVDAVRIISPILKDHESYDETR